MTVPQPEQVLENNLIDQLVQLGYEKAVIRDEEGSPDEPEIPAGSP
jgi:hypothetical protein